MESSRGHIRAVTGTDQPGGTGGASPPSLDPTPFLSALREASEHESHKEEVLEGKTRGIVTVAGAYFAIVQTVTFSATDTLGQLEGSGRAWVIRLAIGAVVLLAFAIAAAIRQHWPKQHGSLPSKEIGQELLNLLYGARTPETERDAVKKLAQHYGGVTKSRHEANEDRVRQYYATGVLSLLAITATTAELIVSLVTRAS